MRGTLTKLLDIARQEQRRIYIVGGYIRDALRGLASRDVDMTVDQEAEQFAKKVAWLLCGDYELLDSGAQLSRVTVGADDGKKVFLDFSLARGQSVEEDLLYRDFTVNAMGVALDDYLEAEDWQDKIKDPAGGRRDLQRNVLRLVSEENLRDDPVRLLRAPRFMHKLGLALDEESRDLIRRNARLVRDAQAVKLSLELFLLLNAPYAAEGLRLLFELGVLYELTPLFAAMAKMPSEEGNLLEHGLATCRRLEELLSGPGVLEPALLPQVKAHLSMEVTERRTRLAFLKLACLVHDSGKLRSAAGVRRHFSHEQAGAAYAHGLARRLKLDERETELLTGLVQNHSRPVYLSCRHLRAPRSRFFLQFRDMVPELLLLALANRRERPNCFPELAARLLEEYFGGKAKDLPDPVISAAEVMEFFGLPPSRTVGRLLEAAYEAQLEGKVRNRDQALSLISSLLLQK